MIFFAYWGQTYWHNEKIVIFISLIILVPKKWNPPARPQISRKCITKQYTVLYKVDNDFRMICSSSEKRNHILCIPKKMIEI